MEELNLVPTIVNSLTSTEIKVADLVPAPAIAIDPTANITLAPTPLAISLTSTDTIVADLPPVPAIAIDPSADIILAPGDLVASAVDTTTLAIDNIGLLGITDLSLIDNSATPSVEVTAPVLATLPTVLNVLNLDSIVIGSKFQGLAQANTINLSDYIGKTLKTDITTQGEAAYTNNIGFYIVEDAIGTIKQIGRASCRERVYCVV